MLWYCWTNSTCSIVNLDTIFPRTFETCTLKIYQSEVIASMALCMYANISLHSAFWEGFYAILDFNVSTLLISQTTESSFIPGPAEKQISKYSEILISIALCTSFSPSWGPWIKILHWNDLSNDNHSKRNCVDSVIQCFLKSLNLPSRNGAGHSGFIIIYLQNKHRGVYVLADTSRCIWVKASE